MLYGSRFASAMFACLLVTVTATAQNQVVEAEPIGGVHRLSLNFLSINFTDNQRELLTARNLEFVFSVRADGSASLYKVNGVEAPDILDSLYNKVLPNPAFHPRVVDGVAEGTMFFMHLTFPLYGLRENYAYHYKEPRLSDFEYIDTSGPRMDVLMAGMYHVLAGNMQHYLQSRGGGKFDMVFTNGMGNGGGLVMNFYGNGLNRPYPVITLRPQDKTQMIMMVGGAYIRRWREKSRRELSVQFEINYTIQNLVNISPPDDNYHVQVQGVSPGVVVNYSVPLGRDRLSNYYGRPALIRNKANFHTAIRPIFMDNREASGCLFEVGVGYRLQFIFVREFKLRADFFQ